MPNLDNLTIHVVCEVRIIDMENITRSVSYQSWCQAIDDLTTAANKPTHQEVMDYAEKLDIEREQGMARAQQLIDSAYDL